MLGGSMYFYDFNKGDVQQVPMIQLLIKYTSLLR